MRDTTERPEAVEAGTVLLVGTNEELIVSKALDLLNNQDNFVKMSKLHNPYGDGLGIKKNCRLYKKYKIMNPEVVTIGLGYIGLPTSALIASHGTNVLGVDINQSVVDTINQGKIHIVEPDLDAIVSKAVSNGFFKASTKANFSRCIPNSSSYPF